MKSVNQVILWYGLYLGMALLGMFAIVLAIDLEWSIHVAFQVIVGFLLPTVFMTLAGMKARGFEPNFKYGKALKVTFFTVALGYTLSALANYAITQVILPEKGKDLQEIQIDKTRLDMEKRGIPDDVIDSQIERIEGYSGNFGIYMLFVIGFLVFYFIIALIVSIFVRNKNANQVEVVLDE